MNRLFRISRTRRIIALLARISTFLMATLRTLFASMKSPLQFSKVKSQSYTSKILCYQAKSMISLRNCTRRVGISRENATQKTDTKTEDEVPILRARTVNSGQWIVNSPPLKKRKPNTNHYSLLTSSRRSASLTGFVTLAFALVALLSSVVYLYTPNARVQAATNNTINFQARLLTNTGALVPDGTYNVEFKFYDSAASGASAQGACSLDSSTDDCWWLETRTGANKVTIKNGYLTANLGSFTAFGATIPWDQELWLSMNIGGTGTPSWDGEMSPRMKVTSLPYAQAAKSAQQLKVTDSGYTTTVSVTTPTADRTITLPNQSGTVVLDSTLTTEGDIYYRNGSGLARLARGSNGECLTSSTTTILWGTCGSGGSTLQGAYDAGSAGDQVIALDSTQDSLIFRNPASSGSDSAYILTLDQLSTGAVGGLDIQSAGTGNLLRITDTTATARDVLVVADGGAVTLRNQTDSSAGFQIKNAAGTTNLLTVDTSNLALTVDASLTLSAGRPLTVTGSGSFPGSPTEGQIYYRTDTKQLYVYANGKWQADRSTATIIVAASDSQNKEKADYVADGTNDESEINSAISALPAGGGSIVLLDGTYNIGATITANKDSVNIIGQGSSTILKRMFDESTANNSGLITITASNLKFQDFYIDGNKATYTNANNHAFLSSSSRNNNKFIDLIITNGAGRGISVVYNILGTAGTGSGWFINKSRITSNTGDGINLDRTQVTIQGNIVSSNTGSGIANSVTSNSIISNNIVSANAGGYGIYIGGSSTYGIVITSNTVIGNTGEGITLSGSAYHTVSGNTVASNTSYGIRSNSSDNTISANTVYTNGGSGIYLQGVRNSIISNTIYQNTGYGVAFNSGSDSSIINDNSIYDNGGGVVLHTASVSVVITNNRITDTAGSSYAISIPSGATNSYLSNNTYSGTGASSINDAGTGTIYAGQLDASGNYRFASSGNSGIFQTTTANSTAATLVSKQGSGQTGDLFQLQDSNGLVNASFNAAGNQLTLGRIAGSGTVTQGKLLFSDGTTDNYGLTLQSATLTANRTITLPNEDGTVCTTGSVCTGYAPSATNGYVQLAPASAQTDTTTNSSIYINKTGASGNIIQLQKAGADVFTLSNTGALTIKNTTNSTNAFQILDSDGYTELFVDTVNGRTTIGVDVTTTAKLYVHGGFSDDTLVVDNANSTGYPVRIKDNSVDVFTIANGGATMFKNQTNSTTAFQIQPSASSTPVINVDTSNARVQIGTGTTVNAKLSVVGTADQTQLLVRANATQSVSNPLILVQDSGGSELFRISSDNLHNFFAGYQAGSNNNFSGGGDWNTFVGYQAGFGNTIGTENTYFGEGAGQVNTTSSRNTAVGSDALLQNWGSDNTAVGSATGRANTTGSYNSYYGQSAARFNQTGSNNTIVGYQAGYGVNTNSYANNTLLGYKSGYALTTGSNNILLGYQAGDNITSGANNIIIGYDINATSATGSNQLNIGNTIYGDTSTGFVGINNTSVPNRLSVNTLTTADNLAQVAISTGATTNKGLVIQGVASQTANLLEIQTSAGSGNALFLVNKDGLAAMRNLSVGNNANGIGTDATVEILASGTDGGIYLRSSGTQTADLIQLQNSSSVAISGFNNVGDLYYSNSTFRNVLQSATLTANRTITLPNEDGTICTTGSVCTGYAAASGSANYIQNQYASAQTANYYIQSASTSATTALIKGLTGQTAAFLDIQNDGGNPLLRVGTGGNATTDLGGILRISNSYNNASPGLQVTNSLNTTVGAFIKGAASQSADLLQFQNSSGISIASINASGDLAVQNVTLAAGKSLTVTGGNTASRPASPTEGMVYYDTTTKQLLTYANGKWQQDRTDAILVAASNSSQADKDAADYVADGNTGAANDGDQVQINSALTAAAGKKVVLLAGTYVADATILVPNNTTLAGIGNGTIVELADIDVTDALIQNSDTGTGTGVTIRDMKLDGRDDLNTVGMQDGVYFNGVGSGARDGGKIVGVTAEDFTGAAIATESMHNTIIQSKELQTSGYGINLWTGSTNNTVTGNNVHDNEYGIMLGASSSHNTISTNTIFNNATGGIRVESGSNYVTITGNTISSNGGDSLELDTIAYATITGNVVYQGGSGITLTTTTYTTVSGNQISGTFSSGIALETASNNNTIISNNLYDNGDATNNNAIYLDGSDSNTITGNTITDSSATSTNYAINIFNNTSDNNYLSGNTFNSPATINNAGTGTIYAGQATTAGGLDIRYSQANSTTAFRVQNANAVSILNIDTTNGELEVGSYNSGTNPVNGKLVVGNSTNANLVTIQSGATSSSYSLTLPTALGASGDCLKDTTGAGVLGFGSCGSGGGTLQQAYDAGSAGDQVIALDSTQDSLIVRNPSSSGSDSSFTLKVEQLNTGAKDALVVSNSGTGNILTLQDAGTTVLGVTDGGNLIANNSTSGGATGTTTGTGTNTTTLTLTSDPFSVNDVIYIDNAGQDYVTRITVDPGTNSYTVSPAVTFETGRTVTKYTAVQNIGATSTDYSTLSNRFFQGYFLGGIVTGAGSTSYADGLISAGPGLTVKNPSNTTSAFQVKDVDGNVEFNIATSGGRYTFGAASGGNNRLAVIGQGSSGDNTLLVNNGAGATGKIAVFQQNGDDKVVIDSTGRLGVGDSSPESKISVDDYHSFSADDNTVKSALDVYISGASDVNQAGQLLGMRNINYYGPSTGVSYNAAIGMYSEVGIAGGGSGGTISTVNAIQGAIVATANGSTIGTANTLQINSPFTTGTAAITTARGVYINPQKVTGVTNGFGIYQSGADDYNYFNGRIGIGTNAPETSLEVKKDVAGDVGPTLLLANQYSDTNVGGAAQINFSLDVSEGVTEPNAQIKARMNAADHSTDLIFSTFNGTALQETARLTSGGSLQVGSSSAINAKLSVVGTANQPQLLVRQYSTQNGTNAPIVIEDSSANRLIDIRSVGGFANPSVAIGLGAAGSASGDRGVFIGQYAGASTTGSWNTAVGSYALFANTTGVDNSAFGADALYANTGSDNSAFGDDAGHDNTGGSSNSYFGQGSGYSNRTGNNNATFGYQAGYGTAANSYANNAIFGYKAGFGLTTGSNNILLGYQAGDNITSGANNIIIGYDINATSATGSNQLNIGNTIYGNTSTGFVGINNTSVPNRLSVNTLTTADANAQVAISTGGINNRGLVVQGVASQANDIFAVELSNGDDALSVANSGVTWVQALAIKGTSAGESIYSENSTPTMVNTIIKGASSQSANLVELQDSNGNVNAAFNSTANQLTLGRSSGTTGAMILKNSSNANTVTIQSGATSSSYSLTLPTALGASGDCLKDTTGAGVLGFGSCGSGGGTLQQAYDAGSAGDQVIALDSTQDSLIVRNPSSSGSDSAFTLKVEQLNTGAGVDALVVSNSGTANILTLQDAGTTVLGVTDGGNLVANNSTSGGATGTTTGTGTNTTTLTLTTDPFSVNDVIYIDNAGQDYVTRITVDPGTNSYTVSPAVTFETGRTVTKYTAVQNIGATSTDYSTLSNRFFQGYFLGGVVTGAGSTTLSDGNLSSSGGLKLQTVSGVNVQNSSDSTSAFTVQNAAGSSILKVDSTNLAVGINVTTPVAPLEVGVSTGTTFTNGFESGTLSPFQTGGVYPWAVSNVGGNAKTGSYSTKPGPFATDATRSELTLTKTLSSAGNISFWEYRKNFGSCYMYFYIDGVLQDTYVNTSTYTYRTYSVGSGTHTFKWSYASPGVGYTREFYLDDITITNVTATDISAAFDGYVGIGTTTPTTDLSFGTGANRTINVLTQTTSDTAGNNLTVNSAGGNGSGAGGVLIVQAGQGGVTGAGGQTTISGGAGGATSGAGGVLALQGGSATTSGAGGNVTITGGAGVGTNQNGGTITITAGAKTGSGSGGQVIVKPGTSGDRTDFFQIQNTNSVSILNIDTTNGELEVGSYNGGTNPVNGKLVVGNSTNANLVTIQSGATSSSYSLTLPTALGASGDCLKDTNGSGVLGFGSCGSGGGTLQQTYDAGSAGDQVITLDSTQDSLIFRNPSSGGTNGTGYVLTVDQLSTGAIGGLDIQSAGTGNLLRVRDTTATAADVFTIADGGAVTFRPQTGAPNTFQILDSSGNKEFFIDTTNGRTTIGSEVTTTAKLLVVGWANGDDTLIVDNGGSAGSPIKVRDNNVDVFSIADGGAALYKNTSNSTTAFQVQNTNSVSILNIDTTNGELEVGSYNGGTNPVNGKLVIGNSTNANLVTLQSGATSSSYSLTLPTALGASGDCLKDTNGSGVLGFGSCGTGGGGTLQQAYDAGSAGDQVIALDSTQDSLIFRNPSSSGTNGTGYILTLDQLSTGAIGGLDIQSAGTGNLLRITDTTATAADVFTIADGGATTFKSQSNNTSAFQVQESSTTTPIFNVDTTNKRIGILTATPTYDLSFGAGASRTIQVETQTAANTNGNSLTVQGGTGNGTGQGGTLLLYAGLAGATSGANGGNANIVASNGNTSNGKGGSVNINSGNGYNGTNYAGDIILTGGNGSSTAGGDIFLYTGSNSGTGGSSGNVVIQTGNNSGTGGTAGTVTFRPGTSGNSTTFLKVQNASSANVFVVDTTNGKVTIDANAQYTQRLCHSGTDGATQNDVSVGDCNSAGQADLAEMYETVGTTEPGDVVVTKGAYKVGRSDVPYQSSALGVVSTNPIADGIIGYNVTAANRQPVALAGRVPVKVSLENGPIYSGDYLTAASTPGFAMKATGSGRVIGVALEDYDGTQPRVSSLVMVEEFARNQVHVGELTTYLSNPAEWPANTGKIMMFVNPTFYQPSMLSVLQGTDLSLTGNAVIGGGVTVGAELNVSGATTLSNLTVNGDAVFTGNLSVQNIQVANITVNGKIITAGNAPAAVVGTAAGTEDVVNNIAAPSVQIEGNDTAGSITIVAGASATQGILAEITFSSPFTGTPRAVISAKNADAATLKLFNNTDNTKLILNTLDIPITGRAYQFDYFIVQ